MNQDLTILGLAGSLRQASFNRGVLREAQRLAPAGVTLEIYDELGALPLFNEDLEKNFPAAAARFKARVRAADAILFCTPEYNFSVPGVLKNAIDWATRPYGDSAWEGKPAAIVGATVGTAGTVRAQHHLRQICVGLNMFLLNRPEVLIAGAGQKFDAQGNLTDADSRAHLKKLVEALVIWTRELKKARSV